MEKAKQKEDPKVTRRQAKELYVMNDKSVEELANIFQRPVRTIWRWKKDDKWDDLKAEKGQSSWQALIELKKLIPTILETINNPKKDDKETTAQKVDAISKVVAAIKKLGQNVDVVGNALHVFHEFALFMKPINPAVNDIINDNIEPFIRYLQDKYKV